MRGHPKANSKIYLLPGGLFHSQGHEHPEATTCWRLRNTCDRFHNSPPARGQVPTGSPSRGGDVAAYVFDINQPSLPTPFFKFFFILFFYLFLSLWPFHLYFFHRFPQQLSVSSLNSSLLTSTLFVLSTA